MSGGFPEQQRGSSRINDIGVMLKTVSEACNLACDYCYYSTCGGKPGGQITAMEQGRIGSEPVAAMVAGEGYHHFAQLKSALPERCTNCEFLSLCHGGCPRNRIWSPEGEALLPDVFCSSYRMVFRYSYARLTRLVAKWRAERKREWRQHGFKLPGRNDRCLCGSNRKFKFCCEQV